MAQNKTVSYISAIFLEDALGTTSDTNRRLSKVLYLLRITNSRTSKSVDLTVDVRVLCVEHL